MSKHIDPESDLYLELEQLRHADNVGQDQIHLIASAVQIHPESGRMWVLYGDLLKLATIHNDIESKFDIPDCYHKAIEIDPEDVEAWTELGYFYDTFRDNFKDAEIAFENALRFGGARDACCGMARVLAQQGRRSESVELLSESLRQNPGDENIHRMKREIEAGDWDPI